MKEEEEREVAEVDRKENARPYYHRWRLAEKPLSKGKIKLNLKGARAIAKVLMPCVAPTKKVAEYTLLYKIVEWLDRLEDFETEMDQMEKEVCERSKAKHTPLW